MLDRCVNIRVGWFSKVGSVGFEIEIVWFGIGEYLKFFMGKNFFG